MGHLVGVRAMVGRRKEASARADACATHLTIPTRKALVPGETMANDLLPQAKANLPRTQRWEVGHGDGGEEEPEGGRATIQTASP